MPTEDMIKNLIEIELGYINTNHPDFCGGANAMLDVIKVEDEAKQAEKEKIKPEGNNPRVIGFFSFFLFFKMIFLSFRNF